MLDVGSGAAQAEAVRCFETCAMLGDTMHDA